MRKQMRIQHYNVARGLALAILGALIFVLPTHAQDPQGGQMDSYPLHPIDRQVDELGSRIENEADALAYVQAFIERVKADKRFEIDENTERGLKEIVFHLARAEFYSARDLTKRIPEEVVAELFNRLMDEWGAPDWTRVSVPELHVFRTALSFAFYPKVAPRTPEGALLPGCRPVEALFLIYMLESQTRLGVQIQIREQLRLGSGSTGTRLPLETTRKEWRPLHTSPVELQREHEYVEARAGYFRVHPEFDPMKKINELLARLNSESR